MSAEKTKANTRHHYVPQSYLRLFAATGKIDVINRETGEVRHGQDVSQVANVRGLYSFTADDGEVIGDFEDIIATHVEGPGASILENLSSLVPIIPKGLSRFNFAEYIAFQHVRTPDRMRSFELSYDFMGKVQVHGMLEHPEAIERILQELGLPSTPEDQKHLIESLGDYDSYEVIPHKVHVLKFMFDLASRLAPYIYARRWTLARFDHPILLTSDSPVLLVPDKSVPPFYGVGFETAKEIIFPISSSAYLIMDYSALPDRIINGDYLEAVKLNTEIMKMSYEEVFAHPGIAGIYSGTKRGPRSPIHIDSGYRDGFVDRFNAPPKRKKPYRR